MTEGKDQKDGPTGNGQKRRAAAAPLQTPLSAATPAAPSVPPVAKASKPARPAVPRTAKVSEPPAVPHLNDPPAPPPVRPVVEKILAAPTPATPPVPQTAAAPQPDQPAPAPVVEQVAASAPPPVELPRTATPSAAGTPPPATPSPAAAVPPASAGPVPIKPFTRPTLATSTPEPAAPERPEPTAAPEAAAAALQAGGFLPFFSFAARAGIGLMEAQLIAVEQAAAGFERRRTLMREAWFEGQKAFAATARADDPADAINTQLGWIELVLERTLEEGRETLAAASKLHGRLARVVQDDVAEEAEVERPRRIPAVLYP